MNALQLPGLILNSAISLLANDLGEEGGDIITRIESDSDFRKKVAGYMLRNGQDLVPATKGISLRCARSIMRGDRVIGPKELENFFGSTLDAGLHELSEVVPYKPETLAACADTHLLVFGHPTTIGMIRQHSRIGFRYLLDKSGSDLMAHDVPATGWFLIDRKPAKGVDSYQRLATVVEAYLAFSLHKETNRTHSQLGDSFGFCQKTVNGGEVSFGLGTSFFGRYKQGSYDYCVADSVKAPTDNRVVVILPDDPL